VKVISKTIPFGDQNIVIESGKIARQAHGSVLISSGGTSILVTVVAKREPKPGQSFFPLGVYYREKTYAAGKSQVVFLNAKADRVKKKHWYQD